MKIMIILLCVCLVTGCTPTQDKKEDISVSTIYQIEGQSYQNSAEANDQALFHRLLALQNNTMDSLVIVDTQGKEVTVSDLSEIERFKSYIQEIELGEVSNQEGEKIGIGVKIQDYDTLLLNVQGNQLCMSKSYCRKFNQEEDFVTLLRGLKGTEKKVQPFSDLDIAIDQYAWTNSSTIYGEPQNVVEYHSDFITIINDWMFEKDPWLQALKMAFFIQEDFTDHRNIQNLDLLTAGLIQQSHGYSDDIGYNVMSLRDSNGEEFHLKEPIKQIHNRPSPDSIILVPEENLYQTGRERLGVNYEIPKLGNKLLAGGYVESFEAYQEQHYYLHHVPYELNGLYSFEQAIILDMKETGKKRTYQLIKFIAGTHYMNEEFRSEFINQDQVIYSFGLDEPNLTNKIVLDEHKREFDIWEYELEEQSDGTIQMTSGKMIQRGKNISNLKLDTNKPYFYEEGDLGIVNVDSPSAKRFNEYIRNLGNDQLVTYKMNENQGFLSILLYSKKDPKEFAGAAVFDMQTWKFVSDDDLQKRLKLDMNKFSAELNQIVPSCINDICLPMPYNHTSNYLTNPVNNHFFVTSKNQLGFYESKSNQIIIFDWEEVQ